MKRPAETPPAFVLRGSEPFEAAVRAAGAGERLPAVRYHARIRVLAAVAGVGVLSPGDHLDADAVEGLARAGVGPGAALHGGPAREKDDRDTNESILHAG